MGSTSGWRQPARSPARIGFVELGSDGFCGFSVLELFAHCFSGFCSYLHGVLEICLGGQYTVPGDDPNIVWDRLENPMYVSKVSVNAAATTDINKREPAIEEVIAHMNHVGCFEPNDAVAIGVAAGEMNERYRFIVEVHSRVIVISH